jgi:hypothetical protein
VTSQDCRSMRRKIRETRLDLARYARVDRVRLNLFENGHIALRDEEITRLVKARAPVGTEACSNTLKSVAEDGRRTASSRSRDPLNTRAVKQTMRRKNSGRGTKPDRLRNQRCRISNANPNVLQQLSKRARNCRRRSFSCCRQPSRRQVAKSRSGFGISPRPWGTWCISRRTLLVRQNLPA